MVWVGSVAFFEQLVGRVPASSGWAWVKRARGDLAAGVLLHDLAVLGRASWASCAGGSVGCVMWALARRSVGAAGDGGRHHRGAHRRSGGPDCGASASFFAGQAGLYYAVVAAWPILCRWASRTSLCGSGARFLQSLDAWAQLTRLWRAGPVGLRAARVPVGRRGGACGAWGRAPVLGPRSTCAAGLGREGWRGSAGVGCRAGYSGGRGQVRARASSGHAGISRVVGLAAAGSVRASTGGAYRRVAGISPGSSSAAWLRSCPL